MKTSTKVILGLLALVVVWYALKRWRRHRAELAEAEPTVPADELDTTPEDRVPYASGGAGLPYWPIPTNTEPPLVVAPGYYRLPGIAPRPGTRRLGVVDVYPEKPTTRVTVLGVAPRRDQLATLQRPMSTIPPRLHGEL